MARIIAPIAILAPTTPTKAIVADTKEPVLDHITAKGLVIVIVDTQELTVRNHITVMALAILQAVVITQKTHIIVAIQTIVITAKAHIIVGILLIHKRRTIPHNPNSNNSSMINIPMVSL